MLRYRGYDFQLIRKNCRHIILKAVPGKPCFFLTAPIVASRTQLHAFIDSHMNWLKAHEGFLQTWEPRYEAGERHWVLGNLLTLGQNGVPSGNAFLAWRANCLKEKLALLLPSLCMQIGKQPSSVAIREMSSRWGSCTPSTRKIRISARLACAPEDCVRYVLAHELCHLLEANHSAAFYRELARVCPDWESLKAGLRKADMRPLPPLE